MERIGIERARQEIAQADRVLFMVDGTTVDEQTGANLAGIYVPLTGRYPVTIIRNKTDITGKPPVSQSGTAIR